MWFVHLVTHYPAFWTGVLTGGASGYLWGAKVKVAAARELQELRAEIAKVRKIV